jgi:hypothetical protein
MRGRTEKFWRLMAGGFWVELPPAAGPRHEDNGREDEVSTDEALGLSTIVIGSEAPVSGCGLGANQQSLA